MCAKTSRTRPLYALITGVMLLASMAPLSGATVKVSGFVFLQYQHDHASVLVEFQPGPPPAAYASTTTDDQGHFEVTLNAPAGYTMDVSRNGYYSLPPTQFYAFQDTLLPDRQMMKQATLLPGGFVQALHLRRADSPFEIANAVLECDTLTLDPGCRLRLMCYGTATTPPGIVVNRAFRAEGTADDSIFFTRSQNCPDSSWLPGILLRGSDCSMAFVTDDLHSKLQIRPTTAPASTRVRHCSIVGNLDVDTIVMFTLDTSFVDLGSGMARLQRVTTSEIYAGHAFLPGSAAESYVTASAITLSGQTSVDACSLVAGSVSLAGQIANSWIEPRALLTFAEHASLSGSTVWGPHTVGNWVRVDPIRSCSLLQNRIALEGNYPDFGKVTLLAGSVARGNVIGLCPQGPPFYENAVPGSIVVGAGALFVENQCFRAQVHIDGGGTATGNLVYSPTNSLLGVNVRVADYGVAVNNLSIGADAGFYAYPFATVHHNAAFDAARFSFSGNPILGVSTQLNANGDSCDAFFNICGPNLASLVDIDPSNCTVATVNCGSPVLGAGDPAFGSRNIGFPDNVCTGVREIEAAVLPEAFSLSQNFPNPFNASTQFTFTILRACRVRVDVVNVLGQVLSTLEDSELRPGTYQATWDGTDQTRRAVASGVYFYRVTAGEEVRTRKMLLLK